MLPYIFIGLLFVAIAILSFLFIKEKNANVERELSSHSKFESSIGELRQKQKESEASLNNRISEIQQSLIESDKILSKSVAELHHNQISSEQLLIDRITDEASKTDSMLSSAVTSINTKIKALATAVEQISRENSELRKKLEFFTEIDEDSKNINETDDSNEREQLIKQALMEVKADATIESIISIDKNETVDYDDEDTETDNKITNVVDENLESSILDEEQMAAYKIMETTNKNLFITGKAGTGKSFLLDMFRAGTKKRTLILAPTGIAALNVKGATLHSTFGFPNLEQLKVEEITSESLRLKSEKRQVLKAFDTLIIDEISMVRVDIFEKIDKILRVLNNYDLPFGGKQVLVFGDLFQLPPVAKEQEKRYLKETYGNIFFFNAFAFKKGDFGFIELTKNHRQKDDNRFFEILNRVREGSFTDNDITCLNDRYVSNKEKLRRVMTLFPTKADADRVNKQELAQIEAREYIFQASIKYNAYRDQTPHLDKDFPFTEELHLKRGALVMMIANDMEKRWVNGTIGIVHSLSEESIKVAIDGNTYDIYKTEFTRREAVYEHGSIKYKEVLIVEQYPVVLAYAITIHKSQGMTYKKIACDISHCFAPGQAYVALSRCSNMDGLYLLSKVYGTAIHINKTIVDFYDSQSTESTIIEYSPSSVKKRANPFKNDPPNGHQPWSKEEDNVLFEQYKSN